MSNYHRFDDSPQLRLYMKRKVILRIFAITGIIGLLIGWYVLHHFLPYIIIKPHRIDLSGQTLSDYELVSEDFTIQSFDRIELNGHILKVDSAKGTIVLLHGIGGGKEHFLWLGKRLNSIGYNAVVYDARAHGESGGRYCTYGWNEKKDLSEVLDLLEQKGVEQPFAVWGNSLGGAVALQALANDKRLKLGVIESTFANLEQITYDYQVRIAQELGLGMLVFRWVSDKALQEAGEIAQFNPQEIQPSKAARKITQPVFIAHGDADRHINYQYGKENYRNLSSQVKEFYLVEGGTHINLWQAGGKEYEKSVFQFLSQNLQRKKYRTIN